MTDTTRNILSREGVDIESAKERMMGNEKLLLRMLFKIDCEKSYAALAEAFEARDVDKAIQASHGLKGMFGNLSVMPLYELFSLQTQLLRAGDFAAAEAMLPEAKARLDVLQTTLSQAAEAEAKA